MYTLVASAAGVGILALAPPAEARIVYTSTNVSIGMNTTIPLDVDNDGVADFSFKDVFKTYHTTGNVGALMVAPAAAGNQIWGYRGSRFGRMASALPAGILIRKNGHFRPGTLLMARASIGGRGSFHCSTGQWDGATDRYLALEFRIAGKPHFGWARLTTGCGGSGQVTGTLTGYAYETVVGKFLHTGQTMDDADENTSTRRANASDHEAMFPPGALGQLALGVEGLVAWRKRNPVTGRAIEPTSIAPTTLEPTSN
jgi:hypothetical protein